MEIVIKPDRGQDRYVLWCTSVDAPIGCGNRARILALLEQRWQDEHPHADPRPGAAPADRVARADRTGSSARGYGWSETSLVYEGHGLLARRDLYRAAVLLDQGRAAAVERLLAPVGDDY